MIKHAATVANINLFVSHEGSFFKLISSYIFSIDSIEMSEFEHIIVTQIQNNLVLISDTEKTIMSVYEHGIPKFFQRCPFFTGISEPTKFD